MRLLHTQKAISIAKDVEKLETYILWVGFQNADRILCIYASDSGATIDIR